MVIYFGADHHGFKLKEVLKDLIRDEGYEVDDVGNAVYDKDDDYVDFAAAVAKRVGLAPEQSRGVVICGSGAGVDIATNKFKRVRSVLAISADQVYAARRDDDVNVLSLAADFTGEEDAKKIVQVFLATPFSQKDRYLRRLQKLLAIEDV